MSLSAAVARSDRDAITASDKEESDNDDHGGSSAPSDSSSSDNEDASSSSSSDEDAERDVDNQQKLLEIMGRDFTADEIPWYGKFAYLEVRKSFEAKGYRINVDAKGHKQVVQLPSQQMLRSYLLRTARRKDLNDQSARREGHFELEPDPILIWSCKEFSSVANSITYKYALTDQHDPRPKPFVKAWLTDPLSATINW